MNQNEPDESLEIDYDKLIHLTSPVFETNSLFGIVTARIGLLYEGETKITWLVKSCNDANEALCLFEEILLKWLKVKR